MSSASDGPAETCRSGGPSGSGGPDGSAWLVGPKSGYVGHSYEILKLKLV